MPAKKQVINLLPREEFEKSPWGRTLRWATTTFRTIVIITELIVIMAFLSRFWLDARNADLNDILRQNEAVILDYSDFENEFSAVQKGIKIFSDLSEEDKLNSLVTKAVNLLPEDIRLVSFSRIGNSLQVKGASASERSIVHYITNLSSEPVFKEIKVTNAAASAENQAVTVFTLGINLTLEKGK